MQPIIKYRVDGNVDSLDVDFDCPFRVDWGVCEYDHDVLAPGVEHDKMHDVLIDGIPASASGWETWSDGYTGQYSYNGPVMHQSELLAGRIARDLLTEPGTYVVTTVEVTACDDDCLDEDGSCCEFEDHFPAGWIVLRLKEEI